MKFLIPSMIYQFIPPDPVEISHLIVDNIEEKSIEENTTANPASAPSPFRIPIPESESLPPALKISSDSVEISDHNAKGTSDPASALDNSPPAPIISSDPVDHTTNTSSAPAPTTPPESIAEIVSNEIDVISNDDTVSVTKANPESAKASAVETHEDEFPPPPVDSPEPDDDSNHTSYNILQKRMQDREARRKASEESYQQDREAPRNTYEESHQKKIEEINKFQKTNGENIMQIMNTWNKILIQKKTAKALVSAPVLSAATIHVASTPYSHQHFARQ